MRYEFFVFMAAAAACVIGFVAETHYRQSTADASPTDPPIEVIPMDLPVSIEPVSIEVPEVTIAVQAPRRAAPSASARRMPQEMTRSAQRVRPCPAGVEVCSAPRRSSARGSLGFHAPSNSRGLSIEE
jgi:hypothetical protein